MSLKAKHFYAFGPFQLDPSECVLTLDGKPVPLAPKAFEALVILVENGGHLVDKDDLMKRLWPDSFVEEGNVAKHVSLLRRVLSEATNGREYIETVPKRGYRFVEDVTEVADAEAGTRFPVRPATRWHELVAGVIAVLLIISGALWFAKHRLISHPPSPELKLRQLTANSPENDVISGSISPDGRYLAYSDLTGIHIQNIETGEGQSVPQPKAFNAAETEWEVGFWFPDSTKFLVNAHRPGQDRGAWDSQDTSIWIVSVLGRTLRKLRDNATSSTISPDGSAISFGTSTGRFGDREIWLMDPSGDHARRLFSSDEEDSIGQLNWSQNSKRVVYQKTGSSGSTILSRDLQGGLPTTILSSSEAAGLRDYIWLQDGRLIYTSGETTAIGAGDTTCNFWQKRIDASTGAPLEKPRRLTNWPGYCNAYLSVTADGKRLAFLRAALHFTTYVSDLDRSGNQIANTRHFTLTESWDTPVDWTADGKAIIFVSNRDGHYGIYKQGLNEVTALLLVSGQNEPGNPRLSPDGNWVLYQRDVKPEDPASPTEILRVSIAGGLPEVVSTARHDGFASCARAPSSLCVIAEPTDDHQQLVVTGFDSVSGRGQEITRFALDTTANSWDAARAALSPDGTRIAAIDSLQGRIRIFSLRGQASKEIALKDWSNLQSVAWDARGTGLFVANGIQRGVVLLHVDLEGHVQVLWKNHGYNSTVAVPSPDGLHLAILGSNWDDSIWMMENF
jgi:DNA-binding winged helix-turn-helix (wHTH) protein/Tol biopolymer transport system component